LNLAPTQSGAARNAGWEGRRHSTFSVSRTAARRPSREVQDTAADGEETDAGDARSDSGSTEEKATRADRASGRLADADFAGYFNYHAVPDNLKRLAGFRYEVSRAWFAALNRRSQKSKMTWARFGLLAEKYLPLPRRVHPYPSQR